MSQKNNLESNILYIGPSSREGRPGKYKLYMDWGNSYLSYKKNVWKRLYFKSVFDWEVIPGDTGNNINIKPHSPRIILKSWNRAKKKEKREFIIPQTEFETWLYWIITGVFNHSQTTIPYKRLESKTKGLSAKHRGQLKARVDLKAFDNSHQIFVNTLDMLTYQDSYRGEDSVSGLAKGRMIVRKKFNDPEIFGETNNIRYGKYGDKIAKGGSDAVIYNIQRLIKPTIDANNKRTWEKEPMVIKVASPNKIAYENLIKETRALSTLGKHPNIITLYDAQLISVTRFVTFLEKGLYDLSAYSIDKKHENPRPPLKPNEIRKFAIDILAGIAHMHDRGVYHLDMKPENVMVCKSNVAKIIDFGTATSKAFEKKEDVLEKDWKGIGTLGYISPESHNRHPYKKTSQIEKRDSYAVGMTILRALIGPRYKWNPFVTDTKPVQMETPTMIKARISHYQNLTKQETFRKRMTRDFILVIADAAALMIDDNPDTRMSVREALPFILNSLPNKRELSHEHLRLKIEERRYTNISSI